MIANSFAGKLAGIGAISVTLLSGCAFVRVSDPATGRPIINAFITVMPWQDVNRTLKGINVTSKTNYVHGSMTGLDEQTATSTNAVNMFEAGIRGATEGAVAGAMKAK